MKKLLLAIIPLILFLFSPGCKDDSGGTATDPFGGGGGGGGTNTGNVTFTVSVVQDNQQQVYFEFKPSTNVVINTIKAVSAALGIDETVNADGTTVYSQTSPAYVGPIDGLQSGASFVFTITGKVGSATGTAYTSTVNYTIP
ncbi:MAG: hypothetical protein C4539_13505 [Ignavibacteriales bacterium]|nr:MAG: hypothetical protein C4539_13505 [Ignavibacteriales bacterium]